MCLKISYICSHKQSIHMPPTPPPSTPPSQRDRWQQDSIDTTKAEAKGVVHAAFQGQTAGAT